MCCILDKLTKPKIAKRNMVVWKILRSKDGILMSPYALTRIPADGKMHGPTRAIANGKIDPSAGTLDEPEVFNNQGTYGVGIGFHAYRNKDTAMRRWQDELNGRTHRLFKAIIPSGSKYLINYETSVSDKLNIEL